MIQNLERIILQNKPWTEKRMHGSRLQVLVSSHTIWQPPTEPGVESDTHRKPLYKWNAYAMKMEIHGFRCAYVCMLNVYFYPHSCSPEEAGDVGKAREGRKGWLITEDARRVQVTSALLSVLPTAHSTLLSSPNFRENCKSSWDRCLFTNPYLPDSLPYIHFLRPLSVLFWGWGLLCILKYFLKLTWALCPVKEASLLHTGWFHFYDILRKKKL